MKYYGDIGYGITEEIRPGIYEESIVEKKYFGDLIKNTRILQNGNSINDNVNISNELSIIADPYANNNFHSIRYAKYMGTKWKVVSVTVQFPRLILTLGGVYNES